MFKPIWNIMYEFSPLIQYLRQNDSASRCFCKVAVAGRRDGNETSNDWSWHRKPQTTIGGPCPGRSILFTSRSPRVPSRRIGSSVRPHLSAGTEAPQDHPRRAQFGDHDECGAPRAVVGSPFWGERERVNGRSVHVAVHVSFFCGRSVWKIFPF